MSSPASDTTDPIAELRANVWNHMYAVWTADDLTQGEFEYRYRQILQLFKEAMLEAQQKLRDRFEMELPEAPYYDDVLSAFDRAALNQGGQPHHIEPGDAR